MPFSFRGSLAIPVLAGMALWLAACAGSRQEPDQTRDQTSKSSVPSDSNINFQLIYIVHGDADYNWHDSTGQQHRADAEAVAQALDVARNSPHSEVFIFHQSPRHVKWFGKNLEGMFYQYRHGILLHQEPYSRMDDSDFEEEARLFHQHVLSPANRAPTRFFIYFGHEIPVQNGENYSHSYPDKNFSQADFVRGLDRLEPPQSTADATKSFALAVLSTCYGGTPGMLTAIAPYAQYVVASPAYLHLSFLDTRAFKELDGDSTPLDAEKVHALADSMAEQSFVSLRKNTQTEITVGVYDMDRSSAFLHSFAAKAWKTASHGYHDCAEDYGFDSASARAGVDLFYQTPRFGVLKNKQNHSGWECPGQETAQR